MRDFAQALPRARKSQERASSKEGGGLLQLPHSRVSAATEITFFDIYAKSGVDLTSRISTSSRSESKGLSPEVVSLFEDSPPWLVARISWACFGLTCLCQTYFVDASERSLRLCASSLFLRRRHQSQQWHHARGFVDVNPFEQLLLSSRKVGPCLTGQGKPSSYINP